MQGPDLRATISATPIPPETYTDYKSLRAPSDDSDPEAIRKAARQFESVFLHLWLKSMRDANAGFGEGSYLSSPAMETHEQMLDGEIAVKMANSGGIGLAEVIERQLSGQSAPVRRDRVVADIELHGDSDRFTSDVPLLHGPASAERVAGPEESNRRGFLLQLSSALDEVMEGTSLPKLGVLAQAALETGWGKHVIRDGKGGSSNNLFGIKATGWQGEAVATSTREFLGGRFLEKTEAFRVYDSIQSAVSDYVEVLRGSSRYGGLFEGAGEVADDTMEQVRQFAQTLQRGGYATDPRYADKIIEVARSIMHLTGGI